MPNAKHQWQTYNLYCLISFHITGDEDDLFLESDSDDTLQSVTDEPIETKIKECEEKQKEFVELQTCVHNIINSNDQLPSLEDVEAEYGWRGQMHGDPLGVKYVWVESYLLYYLQYVKFSQLDLLIGLLNY